MGRLSISLSIVLMLSLGPFAQAVDLYTGPSIETSSASIEPEATVDLAPDGRALLSDIDGFFTENLGQMGAGAGGFYCRGGPLSVAFGEGWIAYDHRPPGLDRGCLFGMTFEGANTVAPVGVSPLHHVSNYLIGSDPDEWVTGARDYREVVYPSLYDGIDLRFTLTEAQLKYEFLLEPWVDPDTISMAYNGVDGLTIDEATRDLLICTPVGTLRDMAPVSYQDWPGGRRELPSSIRLLDGNVVAFEVTGHDPALPLVIDPGLEFCTYIGGISDEPDSTENLAYLEEDPQGNVYLGTTTLSRDFPTTTGAYDTTYNGNTDLVLFKLSSNGSKLRYSTFIGGQSSEITMGMYLAPDGDIIMGGRTSSSDFPVTSGAFQNQSAGSTDGLMFRLASNGSSLEFSTYFGGNSASEFLYDAIIGPGGNIYVTGRSMSTNLPTTAGCYDSTHNGGYDVFVAKFDKDASRVLNCTYVGGTSDETGCEIVYENGSIYVGGWTASRDLPVTNGALQTTYQGGESDGFILRMDPNLSKVKSLTYVGGAALDRVYKGFSFDDSGDLCFCGRTFSIDFPVTANAFDRSYNDAQDGYLAKIDPEGSRLIFATYLGGPALDTINGIVLDEDDTILFVGTTSSNNLPTTTNAYDQTHNGGSEAFVGRMSSNGSSLEYLTYFGGTGEDGEGFGAVRLGNNTTFAGFTESNDLPTTSGAYREKPIGMKDLFVARLDTKPVLELPSGPPVNVTVENRTNSVYISWEEPLRPVVPTLSGYNVYRGNTSTTLELLATTDVGAFPGYLDSSAVNGRTYWYAVSAVNPVGEGPRSKVVIAAPFGRPEAPMNLTATPGCESVHLSWEPSTETGGYPILGYRLHRGETVTTYEHLLDLDNTTTDHMDEGLRNGEVYYYKVQAFTVKGIGENSSHVMARPTGPPSEPTMLTATAGDGFVDLTWQAPLDMGGMPLLGYRILRGPDRDSLSEYKDQVGHYTRYNDTMIENGRTYWYSVRAYSERGDGLRSNIVSATPLGPPSAPMGLMLTPGNGTVTVEWAEPEDDGGTEVLGYHIHRGDVKYAIRWLCQVDGSARSYEDSDLENGRTYYYRVVAFNAVGNGTTSETMEIVPMTVPGCPKALSGTGGDRSVDIEWINPIDTGGAQVLEFVLYRGESRQHLEELQRFNSSVSTHTDISVVPGTTYYYALAAVNIVGEGARTPIAEATPYGPPGPPSDPTVVASGGRVELSWGPPTDDGCSPIRGYIILRGDDPSSLEELAIRADDTPYVDDTVEHGQTYYYAIAAVNRAGAGGPSDAIEVTPLPPATVPGRIQTLSGEAKDGRVVLAWTPPDDDGGSPITGYLVKRSEYVGDFRTVATVGNVTSWTDEEVERGTTYYYIVVVVNDVGQSDTTDPCGVQVKKKEEGPGFMLEAMVLALATVALIALARRRIGS